MMKRICIFDTKGEILRNTICPEKMVEAQLREGEDYIDGVGDSVTEYIEVTSKTKRPRPEMTCTPDKPQIAADGIEVVTLSGLPIPCTLTLTDPEGKVSTFELETDTETINTDLAGTHKIKVRAWPYLDWEGTFDGY